MLEPGGTIQLIPKTYHEVTLDIFHFGCEPSSISVHYSPLNLVVIVVETNNVTISESTNLARRTTNATAHIKDSRVLSDTNLCGEIVLMPEAS